MDIREIVRRLQLGESDRGIARDLGVNRKTVGLYRRWAESQGLLGVSGGGGVAAEGEAAGALERRLPTEAELESLLEGSESGKVTRQVSTVEPYRELVVAWLRSGLTSRVMHQRLQERGFTGGYASVQRYVAKLRASEPREAYVRVETPAGEEAQVDFGSAGMMYDPAEERERQAWAFVMILSHSRHQYVELAFDQKVETWLKLHRHAFEFFGGVPKRVVLDNLKAGIVKASLHDPVVQRAYRELAEHYGFLIAPCRPGTPRHKGKVERGGVAYVKGNFLAGRFFRNLADANEQARQWSVEVAGRREHGTTHERPVEVFEQIERATLQPLPEEALTLCCYRQVKVHPDCHVVFDQAYYSAPYRLVGQELLLKATEGQVELYHRYELVAVHSRAPRRGAWVTHRDHLPEEKLAYLEKTPVWCRQRAEQIGKATEELVEGLLESRPVYQLRAAQAILRLAGKYGEERLEATCARCLGYGELSYRAVKRILDQGLELQREESEARYGEPVSELRQAKFARPVVDFFGSGGAHAPLQPRLPLEAEEGRGLALRFPGNNGCNGSARGRGV